MRGEPEAPSEADQQAITDTVYARERSARIASRTATTAEIERELTHIEARGRYLRRQLKRLQRPL